MARYVLRRIGSALVILWVIISITFVLMHAIPGGPFTSEKKLPPQVKASIEAKYHLDDPLARQVAYPFNYRDVVMAAAEKEQVPPSLVASVILAESKYKNTAESETGALGLMQLMPDTARWVAQQVGHGNYTDRQLKEPETNIELGTWYLGHLLKEFNGDEVQALAAYNAGRGHVESWINENKWNGMVDTIPFPETRSYVKAVLQYQQKYEALYGNDY